MEKSASKAEPDALHLVGLFLAPAVFPPGDGAKTFQPAAFSGKLVEVFHHRRALVSVNEGLEPGFPQGVDKVVDLALPKEVVHLDLILAALDASFPCSESLADPLAEGELRCLVFFVPSLELVAVPAEGVNDLLLPSLPLGSGCFILAADAVKVVEVGVVGVHHGGGLLCKSVVCPSACTYITLKGHNSKTFMGHKVHKDVRRKLANVDNKKASKGATKISQNSNRTRFPQVACF